MNKALRRGDRETDADLDAGDASVHLRVNICRGSHQCSNRRKQVSASSAIDAGYPASSVQQGSKRVTVVLGGGTLYRGHPWPIFLAGARIPYHRYIGTHDSKDVPMQKGERGWRHC